jgi:hypothetical protein
MKRDMPEFNMPCIENHFTAIANFMTVREKFFQQAIRISFHERVIDTAFTSNKSGF